MDYEEIQRTGAHFLREGEYLIFHGYAEATLEEDPDTEITRVMAATGRGKHFVRAGIHGYARLRDLPRLRALQKERRLLDVPRLAAIDKTLDVLPLETDPETWAIFDDALYAMFTSRRVRQNLPSPWAITRRLRRLVATIDSSVNFDPKKRKQRETGTGPSACFFVVPENGEHRGGVSLVTDLATMACIQASITETAREHKLDLADTLMKLLTGAVTPVVQPVVHIYTPRGSDSSAYLPGLGWTGAEATGAVEKLLQEFPLKILDLDAAENSRVAGYSPTPAMADYVRARDGTCVYPDCHRPAGACQLDHRIPYGEGGETTPGNLFALCQHHHNLKTDRLAFYLPDPVTGDTVWLFADGTWVMSENNGILRSQITPTTPKWSTTLRQNRTRRAKAARFNALCHALCDQYERDGDLEACRSAIRKLELEYGDVFEFTPQPEDLSWIPPEPDDGEPAYPDPLEDLCAA
ncbi:HNH endonuclease signature motif containing protein [uncultured Corynebacterium sp.]|uniref:HNH endonuclease signature motif containing protein n=1 Tax=uncultured Corynebacterium sp. TaxID=159447 RepID=UPI002599DF2E|nr:HNH endonuclease signature motif containing protein [uncultured Corynebacterium sp.]